MASTWASSFVMGVAADWAQAEIKIINSMEVAEINMVLCFILTS